jgi:hypothetical protein
MSASVIKTASAWTRRQPLLSLRRLRFLPELIAVIAFTVFTAAPLYGNPDPTFRLAGGEADWLTASAVHISQTFRETGRFPWWQPWLVRGQPAIDESFSFASNPFSIVPSLIFGGVNGVKAAIIVSFALAGLGGWFLGWSLGWGALARLTAAALLILKGNMQSVMAVGNFQLAVAQAYFPWILAGALAVARVRDRRWPPVALALAYALLLMAGNIYYTLPMVLLVGCVALFSIFTLHLRPLRVTADMALLRRYALTLALTAGLMAILAISLLANFRLIANHVDLTAWPQGDIGLALRQFFEPARLSGGTGAENDYSFIAPLWFAAALFIVLPPLRALHRPAQPGERRLWAIGVLGLAWFVLWALGLNPLVRLAYETVPYLGQWRAPERMMPVAAFLLIFLLALRLDGLWRALVHGRWLRRLRFGIAPRIALALGLFAAGGLAVAQVYQQRDTFGALQQQFTDIDACLAWLRAQYPDSMLSVQRRDYSYMGPFLDHQIRSARVAADYLLLGTTSVFPGLDLMPTMAQFYLPAWDEDMNWLQAQGYVPLQGAPPLDYDASRPCIWIKPDALPLAFSLPLAAMPAASAGLTANDVRPASAFARTGEHIWMQVMPEPAQEVVAITQDIAYPGWTVSIDGQPATVISAGRLLGVIVPPGSTPVQIAFSYAAPLLRLGGWITLATSVFCAGYVLQAERTVLWLRRWRAHRAQAAAARAAQRAQASTLPVTAAVAQPTPEMPPAQAAPVAPPEAPVRSLAPAEPPPRQIEIMLPLPGKRRLITLVASAVTALLTTLLLTRRRER